MNPQAELSLAAPVPSAGTAAPLRERLAATPRLACEALCRALNQRDLEGALHCFAPGAVLVGPDGSPSSGEASIRPRLAELLAAGAKVQIELFGVLIASEVALAHERWTIAYGSELSRSPQSIAPTLVLRLIGGEWRIAIAAPWGQPQSPPLEAIWP